MTLLAPPAINGLASGKAGVKQGKREKFKRLVTDRDSAARLSGEFDDVEHDPECQYSIQNWH